jgi:hypothetical protein
VVRVDNVLPSGNEPDCLGLANSDVRGENQALPALFSTYFATFSCSL